MRNNTELLIENACAYPAACILAMLLAGVTDAQDWKMQPLQISTRWAASVNPANALPEYPRPQLARRHWQSLNGLWRYAITARDAGIPTRYQGSILVARIDDADEQLRFAKGYDHNWVLNARAGELAVDATVHEPQSGRVLEVLSTQPGLQFYTGNFLDGSITGKGGWVYRFRNGFCMEPEHFPDSPNHPDFPSTLLKPGQTYRNTGLRQCLL